MGMMYNWEKTRGRQKKMGTKHTVEGQPKYSPPCVRLRTENFRIFVFVILKNENGKVPFS